MNYENLFSIIWIINNRYLPPNATVRTIDEFMPALQELLSANTMTIKLEQMLTIVFDLFQEFENNVYRLSQDHELHDFVDMIMDKYAGNNRRYGVELDNDHVINIMAVYHHVTTGYKDSDPFLVVNTDDLEEFEDTVQYNSMFKYRTRDDEYLKYIDYECPNTGGKMRYLHDVYTNRPTIITMNDKMDLDVLFKLNRQNDLVVVDDYQCNLMSLARSMTPRSS